MCFIVTLQTQDSKESSLCWTTKSHHGCGLHRILCHTSGSLQGFLSEIGWSEISLCFGVPDIQILLHLCPRQSNFTPLQCPQQPNFTPFGCPRKLTNERPQSGHVIWGSMRSLKKTALDGANRQTDRQTDRRTWRLYDQLVPVGPSCWKLKKKTAKPKQKKLNITINKTKKNQKEALRIKRQFW